MTIKEFEQLDEIMQNDLAKDILAMQCPGVFIFKGKPMQVKSGFSSLTWGQWLTLSSICSQPRFDVELIKHLILIFHYKELTDSIFNMDDYESDLTLIESIDALLAYPITKYYLGLVIEKQKEINENISLPYLEADIDAGIKELETFGNIGTLIEYAQAFGIKQYSKVLNLSFNEVYVYLWRETVKEKINRRKHEIYNKQK